MQDSSPDTPGNHKNASRPDGITLKKGHFRRQKINLAPSEEVRAWENDPLMPDIMSVSAAWCKCYSPPALASGCLDWLALPEKQKIRRDPRTPSKFRITAG